MLNPASKIETLLLIALFLLLPTQFGKHFWPDFSLVNGIRIDYLSPTLYVTDILIFLLLLSALTRWWKQVPTVMAKVTRRKNVYIFGFAFSALLLTVFLSDQPLLGVYGLLKLVEFTFLGFYLSRVIQTKLQMTQISLLFAFSAMLESILALLQYLKQGSLNGWLYFLGERTFTGGTPGIANVSLGGDLLLRPYGTFPHPNVLAGYLLLTIILAWFYLVHQQQHSLRVIGAATLVLCSIALLMTFSRVAIAVWIIMVLSAFARIIMQQAVSHKKLFGLLITSIVVFILVSLPFSQDVLLRFTQTSIFEEAATQRITLIMSAITMILHHPITGVGLLQFIPALAPLQEPLSIGLYLQPVHNIFLLITAEAGLIGLGLFGWFLVKTYMKLKTQNVKFRTPLLLMLSTILLIGLFDHYWLTLQQGQLLFATVLGLSWASFNRT